MLLQHWNGMILISNSKISIKKKKTKSKIIFTAAIAAAVVDEISPLEIRLFVVDDRVVKDDVGGGEGAFVEVRFCVLVVCGFCFNSPSGIVSSFSFTEQLEN